jgi:hypothetical protein
MRERQQRRPGRAGAGGGSTAISSTTSDPVREAAFGALDDAPSERAQHDHSCGPPPRLSHERHEYVEPREEHELPRQVEKQSPACGQLESLPPRNRFADRGIHHPERKLPR